MPDEAPKTKATLEVELKEVRMDCLAQTARHRLIVEDANKELVPMREKKELLEGRIAALKDLTDAQIKTMGYAGRQEVDDLRRRLEEEHVGLRVQLATREAYWREEASVWEEKNQKSNERKKALTAQIANFKDAEAKPPENAHPTQTA